MAHRGEVWLVDFGEPIGHEQGYRRPAAVISVDRFNRSRAELAVVLPITSTRRGLPSHIEIEAGESGLDHTSYAKTEDIKSVSTQRLIRRLGLVPADRLDRAEHALRLLLGL
ncbi:MAG: mRNA-degrading endonuclease [Actinobacteria bacterium 69-20]|nr:type II toxin-antitoxin system PemK/MazF family toxin [Actinomycetota bacterium]OJV24670.1 MAG: mRNA-degrading endonuclease [Actinobacteria bacterium 69-20]